MRPFVHVPNAQPEQAVEPAEDENVFTGHEPQVEADCAPSMSPCVPAGQSSQTAAPSSEKEPLAHETQTDDEAAPVDGLYVPAVQGTHADSSPDPVSGLYVPAGQNKQSADELDPQFGL